MTSRGVKISISLLFILVFLSLGLNVYLALQLLDVRRQAQTTVRGIAPLIKDNVALIITDLEAFQQSSIEFEIAINEEFPVNVEVPFNEQIDVPIQMTIPINERIQTTIIMDPLQAGLEIPVDIDVPVEVEVPIDLVIPVKIERTIPISTTVPLVLDFPVTINVGETDLNQYIDRLRTALLALEQSLDQFMAQIQ